jgi:hypothetical protein
MRRSARRRLKRIFQTPLDKSAAIFTVLGTIGTILITAVQPSSEWLWLALALGLISLAWLTVRLYRIVSISEACYFERIEFGESRERVLIRVLHGLLNGEKAQPDFVHAAPMNREVNVVCRGLQENGFATIYGGPGEGKSMTAYHAAHRLYHEEGYVPYTLRVDLLTGKSFSALRDELLAQLDNLRAKRKLIIVDDAHKLANRVELYSLVRDEATDAQLGVIWVETEFYQEIVSQRPISHIRIDFRSFVHQLIGNLYRRPDVIFEFALQGHIEGLNEALRKTTSNQIRDAWHFAFVASQGEKRVAQEISKLDYVETLVLFLISAHTVLSGEQELSTAYLMNILGRLKFGWLTDNLRKRTLTDIIRFLQEQRFELSPDGHTTQRMSLIRLYDKSAHDRGYIASLHYNSAKAIMNAALLKAPIREDLLESLTLFLTANYDQCCYISVLLRSMGLKQNILLTFIKANKQWFVQFLNNLEPHRITAYPLLLRTLNQLAPSTYKSIVDELDLNTIGRKLGGVKASNFSSLADLLRVLAKYRESVFDKIIWADLASRADDATVGQFHQVAELLNALGTRRDNLLHNVAWHRLAARAVDADVSQFPQIADLLNALESRRDLFSRNIAWHHLAARVTNSHVEDLGQVGPLLEALGSHRKDFVALIDWKAVARKIVNDANLQDLQSLGQLFLSIPADQRPLVREQFIAEPGLDKLISKMSKAQIDKYDQIAVFCNSLEYQLVLADISSVVRFANECTGDNVRGLTRFVSVLHEDCRARVLQAVDWAKLCMRCPIKVGMLRALGLCVENMLAARGDGSNIDKVRDYLNLNQEDIISTVEKSYVLARKKGSFYGGIAKFIYSCCQIDEILAFQIIEQTTGAAIQYFNILPESYRYVGQLIGALYQVYPDVSVMFIRNLKIRGKIIFSLNENDWDEYMQDVRHLVKAIYRVSPASWHEMLIEITANLEEIGLSSIYKEVAGSDASGTSLNVE